MTGISNVIIIIIIIMHTMSSKQPLFFFQVKTRHESFYDECWASSLSLHFKGIVSRGNECCFFIITHVFTLHGSCVEETKTQSKPAEVNNNQSVDLNWL